MTLRDRLVGISRGRIAIAMLGVSMLVGLYFVRLYDFLLFHTIAELFSIVVGFGIFTLGWNTRDISRNDFVTFLGVAYLFVAIVDLFHTLTYSGMSVFPSLTPARSSDVATQLWLAARYLEGASLVVAPAFLSRRVPPVSLLIGYAMVTAALLACIFSGVFPTAYVEGTGLTAFKKASEYTISAILFASAFVFIRHRTSFEPAVSWLMLAAIMATIASELSFTFYQNVTATANVVGHYFKIVSFYLIYAAIVQTGLKRPYSLFFRDLKATEELYRSLVEATGNAVSRITRDGKRTFANHPLFREMTHAEFLASSFGDDMSPEDRERAVRAVHRVFDTGMPVRAVVTKRVWGGAERFVSSNLVPVKSSRGNVTEVQVTSFDITDQIETERALKLTEQRFQLALRGTPASVFMHDRELRYIWVYNLAPEFGEDQFIGKKDTEVLEDKEEGEHLEEIKRKVAETGREMDTEMWLHQRRMRRCYHLHIEPVRSATGEVEGIAGVAFDVTGLKEAEEELRRADTLKDSFFSDVAHELQTPVAAARASLEFLDSLLPRDLKYEHRRLLSNSMAAVNRLEALVKDLLDLARLQNNRTVLYPERLDMNDVLMDMEDLFRPLALEKGQKLVCRSNGNSMFVQADRNRLEQVLSNLISNAHKFTPGGGDIILAAREEANKVVVSVTDTGPGISAEDQALLFRRFERLGHRSETKGVGLGLAIAKGLIELHGGLIWVESEPGKGSAFCFSLPKVG